VDVLAKASSASNADVGGLGEALKTAGPIAHAAGKSIEETVAAVEAFSNAGIKGEEAGVAMRQIFIKMASQTPEAKKALKQLGISMTDAAGNLRPIADVVDDFNSKLAGMGSGKKLDMLSTIFDARGAAHFAALLGQGGQALRDFEADLKNSTGAAAEQADTRMDSLSGDWTKFGNAVSGLAISITSGTSGGLRAIVQFATGSINWINAMWTSIDQTFGAGLQAVWQMAATVWSGVKEVTADLLGASVADLGGSMQSISEMVVVGLAVCEFAFLHWKDLAAIAFLKVALGVVTLGNQIAHVFTSVIPATLDWLLTNWREIFFTIADFTMTVFINLGQNIRNVMSAVWDFLTTGSTAGFDPEKIWQPLTEGFISTVRKLPEIADRQLSATEIGLGMAITAKENELGKEFSGFVGQRLTEFQARQAAAGQGPDSKAPAAPQLDLPDNKAPAGIGESKKNDALEMGSKEAFHAAFGGKDASAVTLKSILRAAQQQQIDTQRVRQIQEKNQTQVASF
jgi:minor tail protein